MHHLTAGICVVNWCTSHVMGRPRSSAWKYTPWMDTNFLLYFCDILPACEHERQPAHLSTRRKHLAHRWHLCGELMWDQPRDGQALQLGLEVDALDGDKDLAQAALACNQKVPLTCQPLARVHTLRRCRLHLHVTAVQDTHACAEQR